MFSKNGKKNLYKESYWYENTYESLGSQWLIDSLKKLRLNKNYVLINLSANSAMYEEYTYQKHKIQYAPSYFVGDLYASQLKNNFVDSHEDFHYLDGDNDASEVDESKIGKKADVILDCKGALWNKLDYSECSKREIMKLLKKYSDLLKETGVLLIDYYEKNWFEAFYDTIIWEIKKWRKKPKKVDRFGEQSTYEKLVTFYGEKRIKGIITPLDVSEYIKDKPLAEKMNTAYIKKADLELLYKETEKVTAKRIFMIKLVGRFGTVLRY